MNALPELDLTKIVEGFYRRKGLIIAVLLVVFSLTVYLRSTIPNIYKSSTLILITRQKIPASFVSSTVTSSIDEHIQTMAQQILSRTQLEQVIQDFNLFPARSSRVTMEDRVETFRKSIGLDIQRGDTFQVSFESDTPQKAMEVTARLASIFIQQNLDLREQAATGTTSFMNAEAERLRKELDEQETMVNRYKVRNQYELPEQLDANLRTLDQLRRELQNNMGLLSAIQQRKAAVEKQIIEAETLAPEVGRVKGEEGPTGTNRPRGSQLDTRRAELNALLLQYSDRHPDVIRLKQEMRALENQTAGEPSRSDKPGSASGPVFGRVGGNTIRQTLLKQTEELDSQMQSLQSLNKKLQEEIATYQSRVDGTPIRGIELSKISRTYEITLKKYQDLLAKGLESQLSENMEKKQKGEQFRILDPASYPQKPIRPNRQLILIVGLLAGLGAGFGLAFLLETLDTSFKRSNEVDELLDIPLLAAIPALVTRSSVLERRRSQGMLVVASIGVFAIGVVCIRLFGASFL